MKNLCAILLTATVTLIAQPAFSRSLTYGAVGVARVQLGNNCWGSTSLPEYEFASGREGATSPHTLMREIKEKMEAQYGGRQGLRIETYANDRDYGDHMIIVSANTNVKGCKRFTYGVGFGQGRDAALQSALTYLATLSSGDWKKGNNYQVVRDEKIVAGAGSAMMGRESATEAMDMGETGSSKGIQKAKDISRDIKDIRSNIFGR